MTIFLRINRGKHKSLLLLNRVVFNIGLLHGSLLFDDIITLLIADNRKIKL